MTILTEVKNEDTEKDHVLSRTNDEKQSDEHSRSSAYFSIANCLNNLLG